MVGNAACCCGCFERRIKLARLLVIQEFQPNSWPSMFLEICKNKFNEEGRNLIMLMAENDRLDVLPQVSELFEQLKSQYEGVLDAKIVSAFALNGGQLRQLVANLEQKFKHKINAKVSVDPELIGGVKVEIGDEVLDTSVRGKLEAMAVALKS